MTNTNRFPQISPRVLSALDKDFPGWQDWVPAEKDAELNEDSLITLLKSWKRGELYRAISDKRKVMWDELYGSSEKSTADLVHEFAVFSWAETQKWIDAEHKLSEISLGFTAKSAEPLDAESMSQGIQEASNMVREGIDGAVKDMNTSVDNYLNNFFNKDSHGVARAGTDELKNFLRGKSGQFKSINQKLGERQKEFMTNAMQPLIQRKLDKMKSGELPPDAMDRSDFFTDEEIQELQKKQHEVIVNSVVEIKNSNLNTVNDLTSRFIGVTGKANILNKLNEFSEDLIAPEVKQIIGEAMDYGCIFEEDDSPQPNRSKRALIIGTILAHVACMVLDAAAYALEVAADVTQKQPAFDTKKGFYYFCNEQTNYWAHLFTLGICSAYTLGVNIDAAKKGKGVDLKGMSNALSGFSFLIGLFNGAKIRQNIRSVVGRQKIKQHMKKHVRTTARNVGKSMMCDVVGGIDESKAVASTCKSFILMDSLERESKEIAKNIRSMMPKPS